MPPKSVKTSTKTPAAAAVTQEPPQQPPAEESDDDDDTDIPWDGTEDEVLADSIPSYLDPEKPYRFLPLNQLLYDDQLTHGQARKLREERVHKHYVSVEKIPPSMPASIVVKDLDSMFYAVIVCLSFPDVGKTLD